MIKRKQRPTISEQEAIFLERRAALVARREALRADEDMSLVDLAQLFAQVEVEETELEIEIDEWKNAQAIDAAQKRATSAVIYADDVVAAVSDD